METKTPKVWNVRSHNKIIKLVDKIISLQTDEEKSAHAITAIINFEVNNRLRVGTYTGLVGSLFPKSPDDPDKTISELKEHIKDHHDCPSSVALDGYLRQKKEEYEIRKFLFLLKEKDYVFYTHFVSTYEKMSKRKDRKYRIINGSIIIGFILLCIFGLYLLGK